MALNGKSVLYIVWITTTLSLPILIPKSKVRLALVAGLFKQLLTWPLGLLVVDQGWIEFPIHFYENAGRGSFTFDYFFYPIMCAYFQVYFPVQNGTGIRAAYYVLFTTVLTLAEIYLKNNTQLIRYIHWNGYLTWITILITFYLSRQFCLWFFKPFEQEN